MAHLFTEEVVHGVQGHPDHAGQGQAEAKHLRPLRIPVVTIGHRGVGDLGSGDACVTCDSLQLRDTHEVEEEHACHDERTEILPAEIEEVGRPVSSHLVNSLDIKLLRQTRQQILSTSRNLAAPKTQDKATVSQKHIHSRGIPLAE